MWGDIHWRYQQIKGLNGGNVKSIWQGVQQRSESPAITITCRASNTRRVKYTKMTSSHPIKTSGRTPGKKIREEEDRKTSDSEPEFECFGIMAKQNETWGACVEETKGINGTRQTTRDSTTGLNRPRWLHLERIQPALNSQGQDEERYHGKATSKDERGQREEKILPSCAFLCIFPKKIYFP